MQFASEQKYLKPDADRALPLALPQATPTTCTGEKFPISFIDWLISINDEDDDSFRALGEESAPDGVRIGVLNSLRGAFFSDNDGERLAAIDSLIATSDGLGYFSGPAFKRAYEHFFGEFPESCPESGTKEMRIKLLQKWSSMVGPFRLQIMEATSLTALSAWLVKTNAGMKPSQGHAFNRLLGLASSFFESMSADDRARFPTYEPCVISETILKRIGQWAAGQEWKEIYRLNIAAEDGFSPDAEEWLSAVLDALPHDIQLQISTIEMPGDDWRANGTPLAVDTSSRNKSVRALWKLVRDNIGVWREALHKICKPLDLEPSNGPGEASGMGQVAAALREQATVNLLSHAAIVDQAENKATATGDSIEKSKVVELTTSDSIAAATFRAVVQKSIDSPSEETGLPFLLGNPDSARLIMVKISPSIAATSKYIQHISTMRNFLFMKIEKLFADKHGGRFSHSAAAKLVARAMKIEDNMWAGEYTRTQNLFAIAAHPHG